MNLSLFVSCPRGLEYLLEEEVKAWGLDVTRVSPQGVYGQASLATAYQICVWSRLANRVQLILFSGQAHNEQTIYKLCHEFPWQTVFHADKTLAIEFHGKSRQIRNSMYGAQVVKDAIVDHFRKLHAARPSIDRTQPNIRLQVHLKQDTLTVSFDLTGYSLHQRGYRRQSGFAPIKENVAAAMLLRAKWPQLAAQNHAFYDPFCGSGTLVIEAAMMAAHIAPGLLRTDQSLQHWTAHQPSLWEKVRQQALAQVKPITLTIQGSDANAPLIKTAQENAERAGVAKLVTFSNHELTACTAPTEKGLLLSNPPYGERLGEVTQLIPLYQQLGRIMHTQFQGWQAGFITSSSMLAKAVGLRSNKQYRLYNGALECKLYCFDLRENQLKHNASGKLSEGAQMLANRLQKNYSHLRKWAERRSISCYRLYDADLPEYAYAIDVYQNYAVLQEYAAPATIPPHKVEQRSLDVLQAVPTVLDIPTDHLIVKQRRQQKGLNQYNKLNQSARTMVVTEGGAKLKVNLYDYLDTGLFLDHRPLRLSFAKLPKNTRFLNCFCYTATASVQAALAGALTTNVDLSNTYLRWAEDNFKLNRLDISRHQFIQSDCREWLKKTPDRFDVIFLDPPSFSNSKRMQETLDIQRDHEHLIASAVKLLAEQGKLYFSTNLRRFKLASSVSEHYTVRDITAETIDVDFTRNPRIHQCYVIERKTAD